MMYKRILQVLSYLISGLVLLGLLYVFLNLLLAVLPLIIFLGIALGIMYLAGMLKGKKSQQKGFKSMNDARQKNYRK